ncbi:hypothetical protein ACFUAC_17405 [Streptomyces sp. NPDC057148]|uniref:hypothetical protein n=1 Tax=unclassified Streptomyces TaxID=2593676 RepID=UPI003639554D
MPGVRRCAGGQETASSCLRGSSSAAASGSSWQPAHREEAEREGERGGDADRRVQPGDESVLGPRRVLGGQARGAQRRAEGVRAAGAEEPEEERGERAELVNA